ncbi:hypothetical protein [Pseudomonas sp. 18173]|uniref:hypothetical protein n=1 Tax=Pseudomonas sp. 18173 TaxID=3390055 RepID=UPI003D1B9DA3
MTDIAAVEMNEAQCLEFIEESLKEVLPAIQQQGAGARVRRAADLPIDRDKLNAAILNSTMISFPEGVSRRNKTIVKRTFLFADLTAQIRFPREQDQNKRWEHMLKGMKAMGWSMFGNPTINYQESSSGLLMSNLVLDIAKSMIGGVAGGLGPVLKLGVEKAIEGLQANKEALKVYERNGKKGDGANFGLASCAQDSDGEVSLVLSAISYYTVSGNTKIAFFDKTTSTGELFQSKGVFSIHADDYTQNKEDAANRFYEAVDKSLEMDFGI